MDQAILSYLQTHAVSIAIKAKEGDLLSRRILNLYNQYRAWKGTAETEALLARSIQQYRERVEMGMHPPATR